MVCELGADAVGMVFYEPSARSVTIAEAKSLSVGVEPLVTRVGLFVNPTAEFVEQVVQNIDLECLQFHGAESGAFCAQFHRPYIKAISMRPGLRIEDVIAEHPLASAFLFDAWEEGKTGGTGKTFDWGRLPSLERPWILAGGLNSGNVASAIEQTGAGAVDVSGGVESSPGTKDREKVRAFVGAVRAADF
ncbi:MAG: phosphoribosylanthranilate isomerase [Congregibacter sp.]